MRKVFFHVLEEEVERAGLAPFVEVLEPLGVRFEFLPDEGPDAFVRAAHDADAIVGAWRGAGRPITAPMIAKLERCRVIALCIVGSDRVDVDAATERGIPVTNVPDVFIPEVAEHAMMLILAAQRRLLRLDEMARDGRWKDARPFLSQFPRLLGQSLGLIGFGRVAREVAKRASPFGVRLLAYDPYVEETVMTDHGVEPVGLDDLLARSDVVSLHAPGGTETLRLIGERQFRKMKPTAIFVNTSRGANVDQASLVRALREGWIAGAALDVLEEEPVRADDPILSFDNVILTPHVGSASARMESTRRRRVAEEIALVLHNRWPRTCVNPAALQSSGLSRWQPISMDRGPAR